MDRTLSSSQKRYADLLSSLHRDGFVDDQFEQVRELQDKSNPHFASEVCSLFFDDFQKLLKILPNIPTQKNVDFKKIAGLAHTYKGASSSLGAKKLTKHCDVLLKHCKDKNFDECLKCSHQIKEDLCIFKDKLDLLFHLERQIVDDGCGDSSQRNN